MVQITINGKIIQVSEGTTVLHAAEKGNIKIPTLCDHPDLTPYGGCRLCVVQVKGYRFPMAACVLAVEDGMVVETETPALTRARTAVLEMLLYAYHDDGYAMEYGLPKDTEFVRLLKQYRIDINRHMNPVPRYPVNADPNPFVWVDLNKCIVCTRCVRACAEVQGRFVWAMASRGYDTHPIAGANTDMLSARCESCGACVAYCPTGALDNKMSVAAGAPDRLVTTTCTYCGVGCQLDLNIKDDRIIRVTSHSNGSPNGMSLCVKGRYGYDFIHHPERLTKPMVRRYLLENKPKPEIKEHPSSFILQPSSLQDGVSPSTVGGRLWDWVEVSWDVALDITARKLAQTRDTYGPNAVGVLSSAKCLNEENYLMNKFARQVIGTNSVDHCARLCHSSTVAGLANSLGSGAMTNPMDDIVENAQALFIIGSNTTEQHPVFGAKIRQAVLRRKVKLVVADPRKIDITEFAVLHLRHRPGTDVALINGLMNIILSKGWEDKEFIAGRTEGFDEFQAVVKEYPPEMVCEITGVSPEKLYQAAEILATNKPMAVIWAMGITQHIVGVRNVMDLANLQMLLGNLGVSGGGVNPLRGQNNVQGACDMGGLPNIYPGYQSVTDPEIRKKFEAAWGVPLDDKVGLTVTEMIPAAGKGDVKALYILGEDPVMSDPDSGKIRKYLAACNFIVLQEIFPSETSRYADVMLPGTSFAEKTGTFTNTERRVQMVRKAIPSPGEARRDWVITADLARRVLAFGNRKVKLATFSNWSYVDSGEIMDEIAALTPIYAGISHIRLERGQKLQWPVRGPEHNGTPILHVGQFTRGKGKFAPIEHIPPAEEPDEEYPMVLTTGRVIYHWHGGEMTRRAKGLMEIYGEARIEVNPEDAETMGIRDGEARRVRVTSRRGSIEASAWVTDRVPPGTVFANFHFPEASANELTIAALDPIAKIPEYKVCAVRVEAVDSI